jgi:hypothetical protein
MLTVDVPFNVQRIKSLSIPFRLRLLQFSLPKSKEDDFLYYNKDGLFQEYYRFKTGLLAWHCGPLTEGTRQRDPIRNDRY